jgi:cytochrome c oxidase assembly factor CtaG
MFSVVMIETIFIALWICLFIVFCLTLKRALRQRARECRIDQIRTLRRFTQENLHSGRRHRRQSDAYQPAAG